MSSFDKPSPWWCGYHACLNGIKYAYGEKIINVEHKLEWQQGWKNAFTGKFQLGMW